MSLVVDKSDPMRYPLTDEKLTALEKDAAQGKYKTVKHILQGFALEGVDHPYLIEKRDLCVRFLSIMSEGKQKNALKEELVNGVMKQFVKAEVFESKHLVEEVEFTPVSGQSVCMNLSILRLTSDAFAGMFNSGCKETVLNGQGKYRVEIKESQIPESALVAFKKHIYYQKIDEKMTPEEILPLYQLADMYMVQDLKERCADLMKNAINKADIAKHFKTFTAFTSIIGDKEGIALERRMLEREFSRHSISYSSTADGNFSIDFSEIKLLEQKGEFADFMRSYVKGLNIYPKRDCELIAQIELIDAQKFQGIKEIKIELPLPLKIFKRLLKSLPRIEVLRVTVGEAEGGNTLEFLAQKSNLESLSIRTMCNREEYSIDFSTADKLFNLTALSIKDITLRVQVKRDDVVYQERFQSNPKAVADYFREKLSLNRSCDTGSDKPDHDTIYLHF